MDRLPDEILEPILNLAMMRDEPFCIQKFFHDRNAGADGDLQHVDPSQRSSLQDWGLVVGTCKRFRRLGKEAFFSQKVFVMDARYAGKLRNLEAEFLTTQDQYIATTQIRSIVLVDSFLFNPGDQQKWKDYQPCTFVDSTITPPSSLMNLSRVILSFPRLQRLDHLFGYRPAEGVNMIVQAVQDRRPAASHFKRHLASIGVPTEGLDIGIMMCEGTWGMWDALCKGLYWNYYGLLRGIANMREMRSGVVS